MTAHATAAMGSIAFNNKLNLICTKVQAYWDAQRLPLGYRQAVLGHTSRMDQATRTAFEAFVAMTPRLEIMYTKRGSRYVFPDPVANNLSDAEMLLKMQQVERLRREYTNMARYERKRDMRHDEIDTPIANLEQTKDKE